MFVCRNVEFFGVGETPVMAWEDMVYQMMEAEVLLTGDENPDPNDCEFFEQIEVNISSKTTWSIEPQYEFVDE